MGTQSVPESVPSAVSQAAESAAAVAGFLSQAESRRAGGDIPGAITLAESALAAAFQAGDETLVADCKLELGNFHRYVPNTLEAIRNLNAAEACYRRTGHVKLARALTRKGMTLGDMGDHTHALDLYREALALVEAQGSAREAREEANCLAAIGVTCTQLDDFEQAEDAYRRSIPLYESAGARESIVFVYNNLAILRVRTLEKLAGDASVTLIANQAFQFIDEGFRRNEEVKSPLARAALFNTRGDLLAAMGRLGESLEEIAQSLATYRSMRLPRGEVDALTNMGEVMMKLGRLTEAVTHFEAAEHIVREHELRDHEQKLHELFADAYERLGDTAKSLAHFKRYHQLEAEKLRADTQRKLQQLAVRAEIEQALAEANRQRALSVQLAAQNQALDRIAHEDALTGVANRRRLDEWVGEQPPALPSGMAVAILDIDHFKRINDQYSHATGDAVLREMGAVLRAQSRQGDLVARYGGEEFVVVLHGVDSEQVGMLMERLRMAVQSHDWSCAAPGLAVTTSIGVAQTNGAQAFKTLIEAADAALYEAKHGGRNRVAMAKPA